MARKPKPPSPQLGFFTLPPTPTNASAVENPNLGSQGASVGGRVKDRAPSLPPPAVDSLQALGPPPIGVVSASGTADLDLDSFDDYDDAQHVEGVPRLRLVDPPKPSPRVIVEAVGEGFEVSRLRDNGSTVACVSWTRSELEELRGRIRAALEMSDGDEGSEKQDG